MNPAFLQRNDLRLDYIRALAMSPDGQHAYAGRFVSDDQTPREPCGARLQSGHGAVLARRLYRDSDRPLPASYTTPLRRSPSRKLALLA
jgi:hypothetical protein